MWSLWSNLVARMSGSLAGSTTRPILGIYSISVSTPKEVNLQNYAYSQIQYISLQWYINLVSIAAVKTMTKHSLEGERFISPYSSQPITEGSQCKESRREPGCRNPHAGNGSREHGGRGTAYWLALVTCLLTLPYITQDHLPSKALHFSQEITPQI